MSDARSFAATLTAIAGPEVNQSRTLSDGNRYRIRRGKDYEIRLSDQFVSRVQYELVVTDGEVTLVDAGSHWGINSARRC